MPARGEAGHSEAGAAEVIPGQAVPIRNPVHQHITGRRRLSRRAVDFSEVWPEVLSVVFWVACFSAVSVLARGAGGGGIGLFEILLLAGIGYLIYRFIKKRRLAENPSYTTYSEVPPSFDRPTPVSGGNQMYDTDTNDVANGLAHIRQMDPNFDEGRFSDAVMDIFFKIQGAWMHRELTPVNALLTEEMKKYFQDDINTLIREKKINKLENIAVRNVEVVEAWQESGQDFITARIYANLLDYTTDDSTGAVISGSTTDPVKFEEYWSFTRPVGNNPWKLSSINQS